MNKRELFYAIKELLERSWDAAEVASKCHVDVSVVRAIMDLLS